MNLNGIKITWLGHATFLVATPGGKTLILDPWVSGNPATPADKKNIDKLDYMLISHGHSDHFADAVDLAKKHNPKVVSIYELCTFVQQKGAKQIGPMNKGGTQQVGDIKVTMVNAHHSNTIDDGGKSVPGGEPCGYVIEFENGLKLYHAGDTCVFGDMAIIRELYATGTDDFIGIRLIGAETQHAASLRLERRTWLGSLNPLSMNTCCHCCLSGIPFCRRWKRRPLNATFQLWDGKWAGVGFNIW